MVAIVLTEVVFTIFLILGAVAIFNLYLQHKKICERHEKRKRRMHEERIGRFFCENHELDFHRK